MRFIRNLLSNYHNFQVYSRCLKHSLNAYNLNNYRSLIKIKGPDASKYLQGLITNDIHHLNSTDHKIEYSMILNNKVY